MIKQRKLVWHFPTRYVIHLENGGIYPSLFHNYIQCVLQYILYSLILSLSLTATSMGFQTTKTIRHPLCQFDVCNCCLYFEFLIVCFLFWMWFAIEPLDLMDLEVNDDTECGRRRIPMATYRSDIDLLTIQLTACAMFSLIFAVSRRLWQCLSEQTDLNNLSPAMLRYIEKHEEMNKLDES